MLHPHAPALILAPMEGVTDAPMRAVQGLAGAFTYAVTEFLRITQLVPPKHVFFDHMPELRDGCRTQTGLPVQLQLLGGDAARMAESAARAHELGATAIDINFGCPAKTVNRHDGGAALLRHPQRIREIVSAIRAALPASVPVSAKLRLGWDTITAIDENAAMAAEGGASWITVHGRTRVAGYQPPIFWAPIGRVREQLKLPVVANGDIWTLDDFRRCRDATGCIHFMLGRGALGNPRLAPRIAAELGLPVAGLCEAGSPEGSLNATGVADPGYSKPVFDWLPSLRSLVEWSARFGEVKTDRMAARLKQWLKTAATAGTFSHFDAIKRTTSAEELFVTLESLCFVGSNSIEVPHRNDVPTVGNEPRF